MHSWRKGCIWNWTPEHREAFDNLQKQVTSEPILAHPELDQQFNLEVDASGFTTGAIWLQKKSDGQRHPVGYYSATLNEAEWNYDICNLELLAIVKALKHWRPLLAGSPHKIQVFSDHMNLKYWHNPQKISHQVAREVLELSEYNIEIHHIKGTSNRRADALSRRPNYNQGENDNQNVVILPDKLFVCATHMEWIEANEPMRLISVDEMQKEYPIYCISNLLPAHVDRWWETLGKSCSPFTGFFSLSCTAADACQSLNSTWCRSLPAEGQVNPPGPGSSGGECRNGGGWVGRQWLCPSKWSCLLSSFILSHCFTSLLVPSCLPPGPRRLVRKLPICESARAAHHCTCLGL